MQEWDGGNMIITFIIQFISGGIIGAIIADIIQAQPWFYPSCEKVRKSIGGKV